MFQLFENHDAGTLAHDEAVTILVVGREAAVGSSLRAVDSALQAAKPASEMRLIGDSVPPATMTSASPSATRRAASPMACAPVEQAVTTEWFGPRSLWRIETWPEARLISDRE